MRDVCEAWVCAHLMICADPYRRYAEETGWTDVRKMLITFERYAKLLMNMTVDQTEEEFEDYITTDVGSYMPIGTRALLMLLSVHF
jgi:hypothetical protein